MKMLVWCGKRLPQHLIRMVERTKAGSCIQKQIIRQRQLPPVAEVERWTTMRVLAMLAILLIAGVVYYFGFRRVHFSGAFSDGGRFAHSPCQPHEYLSYDYHESPRV